MEPVAFHGDSRIQIQEHMHTFKLKGCIELTVLDEIMAVQFLEKRKPYLGVCYTKLHADELRKRCIKCMWAKFLDSNSDHFKPTLASMLHKIGCCKVPKVPSKANAAAAKPLKPGQRRNRTSGAQERFKQKTAQKRGREEQAEEGAEAKVTANKKAKAKATKATTYFTTETSSAYNKIYNVCGRGFKYDRSYLKRLLCLGLSILTMDTRRSLILVHRYSRME